MSHRPLRLRRTTALAAIAAAAFAASSDAAPTRIDADGAVRRAVEVSHSVAAATARTDTAQAAVDGAAAEKLPVLRAAASVSELSAVPEFKAPLNGPGEPLVTIFPDIRTRYALGLTLSQPLYTGGAVSSGIDASRRELDAARAETGSARAEVALQARVAYWQAAATAAAVAAATAEVDRAQRLVEDSRALADAGMAVRADLLSADARLAAARLRLIQARAAADDAVDTLASVLQLPAAAIELADAMPEALPAAPAPLVELRGEARTARPELVAASHRLAALTAREEAANAGTRPTVGAVAQVRDARPNERYLPLSDTWNDSWSVGVSADWTLWDGGRTKARVATARGRRDTAAAEMAELQRRVDLDVDLARRGLSAALDAVSAADAAREAAAAREEAVRERYAAGMATSSEVVEAQASLAAAETDQISARTGAWIAAARLERAVGR